MLHLPEITLLSIDCFTPERTLLSAIRSQQWVKFGAWILFTDTSKFHIQHPGLRVIDRKESTKKVTVGNLRPFPVDYELDVNRLPATVLETSHMLFMEWDAGVLNPEGWNERFMEYDYIGAPWPDHTDPGWPPCNETNNVGNGGFALKSKRFCVLTRTTLDEHPDDPQAVCSDAWACRTMRPKFESLGMKYAPEDVAFQFSTENRIYVNSFGFHGRVTCALNNWGGAWLGNIRPKP